ncbi:hypothetical protein BT96DRAFT_922332 [Gymnopus androsaceus JB14]|uniref:Uncharacterized protein n=1 Tax=Gymnopus androsaceus JB14 TaxID=1447944 RepID=A0A6A4HEC5_9AGAR|nr:hypothetical protein BT96DRAFT_925533 [Gymnopus androsaceus JB14]KAE9396170.1 hypothetical protein BT96DRAFT_922332 [Gymnopus androsaceus JB14]
MYRYNSYRNIHRECGFGYRKILEIRASSSAGSMDLRTARQQDTSTRLYFLLFPLSLHVTGVLTELGGNEQMLEVEDSSIDVTEAIIEANGLHRAVQPVLVC